ncbi:MAG TPA: hypothetical protein VFJ57_08815 [Solirubrobacterales bacterium]|nr:hypothetical protein [Solirubrobacterales bacterium]
MELVTHLGLFAAVVATWVAVSGPGEAALPFLDARTRALLRSEKIAQRHRFLGSGLSGLAWTPTVGLGALFVGPSLVAQLDSVGRWLAVAAAVALGIGFLLFHPRRRGDAVAAS